MMTKIKELLNLVNEVSIDDLSSGAAKSRNALDIVADAIAGEPIETKNGTYKVTGRVNGLGLSKGMVVLATYNSHNQGSRLYEILGVTGHEEKYGEGGVKFNSVKECLQHYNVNSLKELEDLQDKNEYPNHSYLVVRDLNDNDSGPWFYLYKGRWSRGSGAEALSFYTVEKVK